VKLFRWRRPDLVSATWLKEQQRRESRIEFHGVAIRWPIRKVLNDSPIWNAAKEQERKRA